MPTKTASPKKDSLRKLPQKAVAIAGLHGVRVVNIKGTSTLELRYLLGMTRPLFGRLVNVSVRTIAAAESESQRAKPEKLQRNYNEIQRLCNAMKEVVDPSYLGDWFDTPNEAFGGLKPIEVIERGEIDRLWEMYYRLRSGVPS